MNLIVTSLLFFPEKGFYASPQDYGLKAEDVFVTTASGIRLHGWFFEASRAGGDSRSAPTLLFFHGNAGNISGRLFKAKAWVERGISVFLIDYRGYGKSEGKIQKSDDLLEDARSALRWLEETRKVPAERVVLYGESIGSWPATQLAREKRFAGLVLEAPFSSLLELARTHYSWVPSFLLKDFRMDNEEAISEVKAPVFILHGDRDEICPIGMGERLYEQALAPKEFYRVAGGGHNDLPEVAGEAYVTNPHRFLSRENHFD